MAVNHCARCFTPPSTLNLSSSLVNRHPPMDRSNSLCQLSAFLPTLTLLQAAFLRLFSLLILQVLCCHFFCHSSTQPFPPTTQSTCFSCLASPFPSPPTLIVSITIFLQMTLIQLTSLAVRKLTIISSNVTQ